MAYFRCTGGGSGATLTLTFSSEFYGQTITATNGTKTVTKVAPSTGTMDITLPESGTWVVSATIDGQTYSTSVTVDIGYSATLFAIPNGSTVTPTDDIQTWLKCAGITDKTTYTTLSDVLSDTDTLIALCADSNACDYMARSTTWADGLVPKMTSNTTPSGTASQSSMYDNDNTYGAWNAFNRNPSEMDGWTSSTSDSTAWMQYEFPNSVHIGYMKIDMNNRKSAPNRRTFIGNLYIGDDPNNLTEVLHNFEVPFISGTSYELEVAVNATGKYVKIETVQPNIIPSGYNYTALFGVQFYASNNGCISITEDATAMLIVGKYNYCANALLGNSTWASALASSSYWQYVFDISVPNMTGNTAPSGEVSATNYLGTNWEPWRAFDGNYSSNGWHCAVNSQLNNTYIQYKFTQPVVIKTVSAAQVFLSGTPSYTKELTYKLLASNDNFVSDTHELATNMVIDDFNDIKYFAVNNDTAYQYYRMVITGFSQTGGADIASGYGNKFQFYGRTPVSQDYTLIHSAVEDSIFYMDEGTPVALCTIASGDTIDVDMESFKGQTLTLVSTVAKDPTNLSNDFSMNVRITPNITEIYLMPVKELYWYGHEGKLVEDTSPANGWSHGSWTFIAPNRRTNYIDLHASTSISDTKVTGIGTKWANNLATNVHCVYTGITLAYDDYGILSICSTKDIDGTRLSYESLTSNTMTKITKQIATGNYAGLDIGRSRQAYVHALWLE